MGTGPTDRASVEYIEPSGSHCGTWAHNRDAGVAMAGLQRAVPITQRGSPCQFVAGAETMPLYLHRNTAFGDGHYLLSAVTDAGEQKWSLDLSARLDPDLTYDVLLAEQVGTNLRLLVGGEDAIYFLELEMASGHMVRERALY